MEPGYYWALQKKVSPGTRDGDEILSNKIEVVEVVENTIYEDDPEHLMVMVLGVEKWQALENFEFYGPVTPMEKRS